MRRLPIMVLVVSTLGANGANTFASLALDLWMFEPLNRRRAQNSSRASGGRRLFDEQSRLRHDQAPLRGQRCSRLRQTLRAAELGGKWRLHPDANAL